VNQHSRQEVNWEFLLSSSKSTLQAYEQSRLNFATNLRKEIEQLLQVWVDESSNALLARWLIERNLVADAEAVSKSAGSSVSEFQEQRRPLPCALPSPPKPPARSAPHVDGATHSASDKLFGGKSFPAPRIHAAS
jgi:hypothetical protein